MVAPIYNLTLAKTPSLQKGIVFKILQKIIFTDYEENYLLFKAKEVTFNVRHQNCRNFDIAGESFTM